MVLKFYCSESRFLNMGIVVLKRLLQEAKTANDVITLEATVITGFESQAVDECREVCKPENVARSKGRIFFNIKKESYPNVLKMRSIDNIFLVSEAFEELKLKKVKEDDLVIIKHLAEQVNWGKSVPEWAEIVGFKGIQFPKCASKAQNEPSDEKEPVCQNCQIEKPEDGDDPLCDVTENVCDRPKINLISDEEVFQTPLDECAQPDCENPEQCQTEGCAPKDDPSDEEKIQSVQDKNDSALESTPEGNLLAVKQPVDTDDDVFHSAEEDVQLEEPTSKSLTASGKQLEEISCPEGVGPNVEASEDALDSATNITPKSASTGAVKSNDGAPNEPTNHSSQVLERAEARKQDKFDKKKPKRLTHKEKRVEVKRDCQSQVTEAGDATSQPGTELAQGAVEKSDPQNECINPTNDATLQNGSAEAIGQSNPPKEKIKSYWQKRREAKAKKAAEAEAKKPPRKVYVDDGIMKFRVTCYRNGPKHSFESNDAAGHFGGRINDKFHWNVDLTRYDINVVLVIESDSAYVSLALTTKSLHRRNIKNFGPTTLRATLCYGLLRLAEPVVGDIIIDPMCGGGSISLEGSLAFPGTFHICGDVNEKCMERVADNIAYNSKTKPLPMDGLRWSVRRLPLQDHSVDVIVTDLPFGLRVGKQKDNTGLYISALFELSRVVRTCGRAALLTYDRTAMIRALQRTKHLWREIHCNMVNQGGLRCFAYLLLRRNTAGLKPEPARETSGDHDTPQENVVIAPRDTSGDRDTAQTNLGVSPHVDCETGQQNVETPPQQTSGDLPQPEQEDIQNAPQVEVIKIVGMTPAQFLQDFATRDPASPDELLSEYLDRLGDSK